MVRLNEYLNQIENPQHRIKMTGLLQWVHQTFPELKAEYKWNQPMFTHHGTFIIAFSVAQAHISVGTEGVEIPVFEDELNASGYSHSKMIFRIKWNQDIDYELLQKFIRYNMKDKEHCTTFWRK